MSLIKTFKVGAHPVIGGVEANGRENYAIALKKRSGNILLDNGNTNYSWIRLPVFIRGFLGLFQAGGLVYKLLDYSANYFDNEEIDESDNEILSQGEWNKKQDSIKAEKAQESLVFSGFVILAIIAIFAIFLLPPFIASIFFDNVTDGKWLLFNVVECVSRIALIFICLLVSKFVKGKFGEFKRNFSAANKALNCYEARKELSYENVKASSPLHPRTVAFIVFLTIFIASIALIFFRLDNIFLALLIRLGIVILSADFAFELTRFFGMFNGKFSRFFAMIFGMWTECFLVEEPDDMQIYVAIAAVKNAMIEG